MEKSFDETKSVYNFRGYGKINNFEFRIEHKKSDTLPSTVDIIQVFSCTRSTCTIDAKDLHYLIQALQDIQDFMEDHGVLDYRKRKEDGDAG